MFLKYGSREFQVALDRHITREQDEPDDYDEDEASDIAYERERDDALTEEDE